MSTEMWEHVIASEYNQDSMPAHFKQWCLVFVALLHSLHPCLCCMSRHNAEDGFVSGTVKHVAVNSFLALRAVLMVE